MKPKMTEENWKTAAQMLIDGCNYQQIADEFGITRQSVNFHFTKGRGRVRNPNARRPIVYAGIKRFVDENPLSMRQIALRIFPDGDSPARYYKFANIATGRTQGVRIKDIFTICRYMGMPFEEAFAPVKEDDHDNSAV